MTAKSQMNLWTPREMDGYAGAVRKGFCKNRSYCYKPLMDEYAAMDIPQPYCIVETENADALQEAVEGIPALGKWSRKGYGRVVNVTMESTEDYPWVLPDGRPARALPVELWQRWYGGSHALSMEVINAPYWGSHRAQLCAVEN